MREERHNKTRATPLYQLLEAPKTRRSRRRSRRAHAKRLKPRASLNQGACAPHTPKRAHTRSRDRNARARRRRRPPPRPTATWRAAAPRAARGAQTWPSGGGGGRWRAPGTPAAVSPGGLFRAYINHIHYMCIYICMSLGEAAAAAPVGAPSSGARAATATNQDTQPTHTPNKQAAHGSARLLCVLQRPGAAVQVARQAGQQAVRVAAPQPPHVVQPHLAGQRGAGRGVCVQSGTGVECGAVLGVQCGAVRRGTGRCAPLQCRGPQGASAAYAQRSAVPLARRGYICIYVYMYALASGVQGGPLRDLP
ncbi:MAG: hypothetical protein J3K34DRAFT_27448 [Monoraphidium minutum]|nr:MAG: hypothetical protein J3K34DRAFT_27448 [Monoraphidium minutum]